MPRVDNGRFAGSCTDWCARRDHCLVSCSGRSVTPRAHQPRAPRRTRPAVHSAYDVAHDQIVRTVISCLGRATRHRPRLLAPFRRPRDEGRFRDVVAAWISSKPFTLLMSLAPQGRSHCGPDHTPQRWPCTPTMHASGSACVCTDTHNPAHICASRVTVSQTGVETHDRRR